ncbi:MAG TPA: PIG-L deacetylase family protein [Nitrosopumilaceae archaeon]|nr:PIG-L deacetylase family protein [Nitrosopumilaceae archaeon]
MKIVSVGSHPDDVELGMGGTLVKHKDRGDDIFVILCTLGGVSGDPRQREEEALKAISILGVKKLRIINYPVSKLNKPTIEFEKIMKKIIDEISPNRVYTHSPFDYHQVHVGVSKMVTQAANDIDQILFYETISSTTPEFKPNAFVDITKQINTKIKSVKAHKSQSNRFYIQPNTIKSLANTRYVWGKVGTNPKGLAEAFKIHKFIL